MKTNKGITLIALVVTIIVLIILAAVSINLLLSDNGIIKKSRDAKLNYELAANEESTNLKEIEDKIDILTGESKPVYAVYTLGQEVTVGGEQFFVIEENDTEENDKITLITKYNLNPSSNTQLNARRESTRIEFCTDPDNKELGYWNIPEELYYNYKYELNGIESTRATAYNKAKAYGVAKGGTGRLLTKTEAETLATTGKIPKIIYGQDYETNPVATDNFLHYWLGTALNRYYVYFVYGQYSIVSNSDFADSEYADVDCNSKIGVRPVITISKSLVS